MTPEDYYLNTSRTRHPLAKNACFIVQSNRIAKLPEEMGSLARLKTLDVSNNDLAELPAALGYLPELHRLAVDGNPLRTVRRSLLSGGASSLKVCFFVLFFAFFSGVFESFVYVPHFLCFLLRVLGVFLSCFFVVFVFVFYFIFLLALLISVPA